MIMKFYEASQAGVKIDLIIRGICMLRPGVPGLSESITVRSVVGRFLEHSRVFYFENCGKEELYIGSADLKSRNLKHRIEVLAPVRDRQIKNYLKDEVLATYLRDTVKARELQANGTYRHIPTPANDEKFDSQSFFVGRSADDTAVRKGKMIASAESQKPKRNDHFDRRVSRGALYQRLRSLLSSQQERRTTTRGCGAFRGRLSRRSRSD
jgi:polyphosphate kinase